jgi:antitoxin component of MazEF toxin-antitoxin module
VQTKIQKVGDGFGLLLPKEMLDACGFGTEAVVTVQDKVLIVSPGPRHPREGWAEALDAVPQEALQRDFAELQTFRETPDEWDAKDWQWPDTDANEKV